MSKAKRAKYCWDTSVFLAWIKGEEGAPLDDIALVAEDIDAARADLIVPVNIYTEFLEAKHTKKQIKQFELFLKRSNVQVVNTTVPIAQKAGSIRSKLHKLGGKLKTPDAQVIATAIIYGVDAVHTLDQDMLKLNGFAEVDGMRITKPMLLTGQKGLPHFAPSDDDDQ
ncbi:MAG: PIN domain-containing protein [Planctomycetia bacterium]|nr:PIN domain-containing protein [Planctomycetia bacterium]